MILKKKALTLAVLATLSLSGCGEETGKDSDTGSSGGSPTTPVEKPSLSIELTKSIVEPPGGQKSYAMKVSLSSTAKTQINVDYELAAITATADADFVVEKDTLTINAGARSAEIPFTINGDLLDEDNETFSVKISNATGATIRENANIGTVTIRDEDEDSKAGFETEFATVAEGSGVYKVKVKLSSPTEREVQIPFSVSGLATVSQDYMVVSTSPLTVPAGSDEVEIDLNFLSDSLPEGGESVIVQLLSPTNAELDDLSKLTIMIPGDVGLNDTGVTTWFDGTNFDSTGPESAYPGQDAEFGRDTKHVDAFDGHAAFSFTKLDSAGNALPSNAGVGTYVCVKDNRTGLVWEVKQPDETLPLMAGDTLREEIDAQLRENRYEFDSAHENWRASNYTYAWFNTDDETNGGADGATGGRFEKSTHPISANCAYAKDGSPSYSSRSNRCNTQIYTDTLNSLAVCGFKDWRVPEIGEMTSIQNYRATAPESGEEIYFPNAAAGDYLSATPSADGEGAVWCMDTTKGQVKLCNKQLHNHIRMVRGGSL
ncbi:Calx-beta domain-containing protein [Vibrio crassostreae]|nr:conserved exported hypothetical protein [Vibrio chagasii]CAK2850241.1 Calx-beta domain-containing protein [Vibrio crassostreae]